ncbi:MAG: hypothetical protein GY694_09160 [Gammaproteobacteria bacterium]|nr:hypothetical protein [Gammaproteobacteria bacterium]
MGETIKGLYFGKNTSSTLLYDSGVKSDDDNLFTLASGEKIEDRKIAKRFPTSFVLDKSGIVVFSHNVPFLTG